MKVETAIDDEDLDDRFPDDDDEDDDGEPVTALYVMVRAGDGKGHSGTVVHVGADATPEVIAEGLVSALHGAARTYSVAAAAALERWLVTPPDLKVDPGATR